jgi:hypothetical protein
MQAVCGFLRLTDYYRKFIRSYCDITEPLTQLLKRNALRWTPDTITAFESLKETLTMVTVLQLLDFDKAFMVDCDASGSGIGVILHQGGGTGCLRFSAEQRSRIMQSWRLMSVNSLAWSRQYDIGTPTSRQGRSSSERTISVSTTCSTSIYP